jgi:hypothetical protein
MLYKSEAIRELCEQSFAKSDDKWYQTFAKAAEDFNKKGRLPLEDANEAIQTAEATSEMDGGEAEKLVIQTYEARMPTGAETILWLRDVIKPFDRPRRRGRGVTNWEKVQAIKDDAFKVAILKLVRILNAVDWARDQCLERTVKADDVEVDHWTDRASGWTARGESIDECEDLDDWFPGSENLKEWLEQIHGNGFMDPLESSGKALEEYAE